MRFPRLVGAFRGKLALTFQRWSEWLSRETPESPIEKSPPEVIEDWPPLASPPAHWIERVHQSAPGLLTGSWVHHESTLLRPIRVGKSPAREEAPRPDLPASAPPPPEASAWGRSRAEIAPSPTSEAPRKDIRVAAPPPAPPHSPEVSSDRVTSGDSQRRVNVSTSSPVANRKTASFFRPTSNRSGPEPPFDRVAKVPDRSEGKRTAETVAARALRPSSIRASAARLDPICAADSRITPKSAPKPDGPFRNAQSEAPPPFGAAESFGTRPLRSTPDVHSRASEKEAQPLPRTLETVEGSPRLRRLDRPENPFREPSSADLLQRRELDERWPELEPRPPVDVREELAPALRRLERAERLDREQRGSPWTA